MKGNEGVGIFQDCETKKKETQFSCQAIGDSCYKSLHLFSCYISVKIGNTDNAKE